MYSFKEHYDEIAGQRLKVKYTDGDEVTGDFVSIDAGLEYDDDYDLLKLDTGEKGIIIGCSEDEIEDIEVLSEKHGEWM